MEIHHVRHGALGALALVHREATSLLRLFLQRGEAILRDTPASQSAAPAAISWRSACARAAAASLLAA